ncbi:MAG: ABC transporter permease [Clostridiaceae bacterium]|nr:ABC transporter permease [Clostridiaceae bacterium]
MKTKTTILKSSLSRRNYQKFIANRLAVAGCVIMFLILAASLAAPLLTPYDPTFIDLSQRELPISWQHPLGTDRVGRDIMARLLYGGRVSILIGLVSAGGAALVGVMLGCISGYYGGWLDKVLLFISELFMTFPRTLLVLLCVGILGQSTANMIGVFILTGWPGTQRIVRAKIISLREEPFVESCVANGVSAWSIMFHHLLPNTLGPIIVSATTSVAGYILSEAGLSFLGMGVPPDVPTWGNIINAAKRMDIVQNLPMLWIAPGVAISLFVLSVNFLGDGLRDAFDATQ